MSSCKRVQIVAKSLYRNVLSQGFEQRDVILLATELLEQLVRDKSTDLHGQQRSERRDMSARATWLPE